MIILRGISTGEKTSRSSLDEAKYVFERLVRIIGRKGIILRGHKCKVK